MHDLIGSWFFWSGCEPSNSSIHPQHLLFSFSRFNKHTIHPPNMVTSSKHWCCVQVCYLLCRSMQAQSLITIRAVRLHIGFALEERMDNYIINCIQCVTGFISCWTIKVCAPKILIPSSKRSMVFCRVVLLRGLLLLLPLLMVVSTSMCAAT